MEKIITEKTDLSVGWHQAEQTSFLVPFPEIEKHLSEGWRIKQMFVNPYGNKNATHLVITVHLERL